jgi:hypothetical protein
MCMACAIWIPLPGLQAFRDLTHIWACTARSRAESRRAARGRGPQAQAQTGLPVYPDLRLLRRLMAHWHTQALVSHALPSGCTVAICVVVVQSQAGEATAAPPRAQSPPRAHAAPQAASASGTGNLESASGSNSNSDPASGAGRERGAPTATAVASASPARQGASATGSDGNKQVRQRCHHPPLRLQREVW